MVQVVDMTDEEKFEMYMKVPHEELVRMKIEEERILKMLEKKNNPTYYTDENQNNIKVHVSSTISDLIDKTEEKEKEEKIIDINDLFETVEDLKKRVHRLESQHSVKKGGYVVKTNPDRIYGPKRKM